jgi:hypothetical protein
MLVATQRLSRVVSTLVLFCTVGVALAQEAPGAVVAQPPPAPLLSALPEPVQPSPPLASPSPPPASPSPAELIAALSQRIAVLEEESRRAHAAPVVPKLPEPPQTETFEARWRNAFVIQSLDGAFRLRVGGLI